MAKAPYIEGMEPIQEEVDNGVDLNWGNKAKNLLDRIQMARAYRELPYGIESFEQRVPQKSRIVPFNGRYVRTVEMDPSDNATMNFIADHAEDQNRWIEESKLKEEEEKQREEDAWNYYMQTRDLRQSYAPTTHVATPWGDFTERNHEVGRPDRKWYDADDVLFGYNPHRDDVWFNDESLGIPSLAYFVPFVGQAAYYADLTHGMGTGNRVPGVLDAFFVSPQIQGAVRGFKGGVARGFDRARKRGLATAPKQIPNKKSYLMDKDGNVLLEGF